MSSAPAKSYTIGGFVYHPHFRELVKGNTTTRLEERAAQALDMLCRNNDKVVSRDELIQEIWQGRVVSDNSVAVVISDLRKAFNDDARAPKIIQTVPKRGYRALDVTLQEEAVTAPITGHVAALSVARNKGLEYMGFAACISCSLALIVYFIT